MTGQVNFNSHSAEMVALAADLVNTATPGMRQTRPYAPPEAAELAASVNSALTRWDRHATALDQAAARRLADRAPRLREVFALLDAEDPDRAAAALNALLGELRPAPFLDREPGRPWHLYFRGPGDDPADDWAASCAIALATALGSDYAQRLGVCSAPSCDRVYVDTSRNGTRRFCSTACQNRVKAAAHRARQRESRTGA
ncbi:CGNR zinc finger domain-containing protein [Streptomyces sp. NPDC001941]|uniref:CGNR zinc finger domain-containing protein n=1 Tax=Streptomyces sp. NPDC001941 TaxID=3154659 RepID=UPI003322A663